MDDKESLEALIDQLPQDERAAYRGMGSLSLEAGFPNRVFVIYTLQQGQPENLSVVKMGDLTVTRLGGIRFEMTDEQGTVEITTTPQRWRGLDLFIHVPQNFILRTVGKSVPGKGVQFAPHYAVLVKSRSREHLQVDKHTYCVTLNKFRERFPKVPIRY